MIEIDPAELSVKSHGPIETEQEKFYNVTVEETATGNVLFSMWFTNDPGTADTLCQSLAMGLNSATAVNPPIHLTDRTIRRQFDLGLPITTPR